MGIKIGTPVAYYMNPEKDRMFKMNSYDGTSFRCLTYHINDETGRFIFDRRSEKFTDLSALTNYFGRLYVKLSPISKEEYNVALGFSPDFDSNVEDEDE